MKDQYWVGMLRQVGEVVYDPTIQDDESEFVLLFHVRNNELAKFNRTKTRGKIKRIQDSRRLEWCIKKYEEWKSQSLVSASGLDSITDIGLARSTKKPSQATSSTELDRVADRFEALLNTRDSQIESLQKKNLLLQQDLDSKEKKLSDAQSRINILEQNKVKLDQDKERQDHNLSMARMKILELEQNTANSNKNEEFDDLARQAALFASNGHDDFRQLISPLKLDSSLPIQIATKLETKLRIQLRELDPSISLFELIKQSQETGILDEQALDMAHIIRKQRNAIAHAQYTKNDATARILLVLYSAAILWPKLS